MVFVGCSGSFALPGGAGDAAVTQNRAMAESMGIRTARVDALTFGLGSGIAGIAGVALSQIDNVSPNLGQGYIIDSFLVVVFGGVGNLWGTLVGALSPASPTNPGPFAGAVLAKIAILVFIILFIQKRPRGLFALKGRAWRHDDAAAPSRPRSRRDAFLCRLAAVTVPVPLLNLATPETSFFHVRPIWWRCSASTSASRSWRSQ